MAGGRLAGVGWGGVAPSSGWWARVITWPCGPRTGQRNGRDSDSAKQYVANASPPTVMSTESPPDARVSSTLASSSAAVAAGRREGLAAGSAGRRAAARRARRRRAGGGPGI